MLSRHRGDIGRQIRTLRCRDDEDMKERGLKDQRTRMMKDKGKMNVDDECRAVDLGELWVDKSCLPRLLWGREDLWEITYNYKVVALSSPIKSPALDTLDKQQLPPGLVGNESSMSREEEERAPIQL